MLYRIIYSLGMYLMSPVILYRLAWRGLRYREYLERWPERFGMNLSPQYRHVSGSGSARFLRPQ